MFDLDDVVLYQYNKYIVHGFHEELNAVYLLNDNTIRIIMVDKSAVKSLDMRPYTKATVKQLNAIKFVERYTDHEFKGKTIQDLSDFLSKYLNVAKANYNDEYDRWMESDAMLEW